MWNVIVQDISITYERKIFYLQLLIDKNVDTERLFVLNDNNEMSGFIEEIAYITAAIIYSNTKR